MVYLRKWLSDNNKRYLMNKTNMNIRKPTKLLMPLIIHVFQQDKKDFILTPIGKFAHVTSKSSGRDLLNKTIEIKTNKKI